MSGCKRGMAVSLHGSVSPLMNLCDAFPSPCPTVLSATMALHQPRSLVFDNSHFHEGDGILIVPVFILLQGDWQWPLSTYLLNMCIWTGVFVHFKTLFHCFLDNFTLVYNVPWSYPPCYPPPKSSCLLECSLILSAPSYAGNSGYCEFMSTVAASWLEDGISQHSLAYPGLTLLSFHCWDVPWVLGLGC